MARSFAHCARTFPIVEKNVDSSVAFSSCQRSAYRSRHTPCFQHASGQPTAHVTRPAFSMPAVSLPLTPHALCLACQRSSYRSMSMRMVLMTMTMTTTTTTTMTTTRLKPAVHPPHSFNESWQIRWNCSFRKELFCLLPCWGHCHVGNKRECGVGGGDRGRPWSSQARQQSLTTVSLAG